MQDYPVDNLLREPTEIYSGLCCFAVASLTALKPHLFLLTKPMGVYAAASLALLGAYRLLQALRIKIYHKRLFAMPRYELSTKEVPLSQERLFVGRGFRWLPSHTQRLQHLKQIKHEKFIKKKRRENKFLGGHSFLHGLGSQDKPVFIPQDVRVGHTFVVGTTRVGKTRLASLLINQDIRNGDAVIVVDPKGDLELVRDMVSACKISNRLDDFRVVHLGFPERSALYNPLKHYDQVSEVATRITDAISAEGEGKQFAAFAWKYVNIVAICLEEMDEPITYKSIAFYISRLDQLLMRYADNTLAQKIPGYHEKIEKLLTDNTGKLDRSGKTKPPMERAQAVIQYLKAYITQTIQKGEVESLHDQILLDLFDAATLDKHYYDKITASVGPVLSEINKSNASTIFSYHDGTQEISIMDIIKKKKVLYIGLDSLTNPNVAQAVGKALLSDLVSTAGKLYKESQSHYRLNLHCDELSEIIQDAFVKILNKAGGAGFQVTAYAQTIQDMEVALGSKAKSEATEGNLNTLIMLRVKNEGTANLLVKALPKVDVINHTQVSMVNDMPIKEEGVYFNTTNEDRVQTTAIPMLDASDILALPKGQAFMLVNGGELFKVRMPLPKHDGLATTDIKQLIAQINQQTT